jgi:SIR2-like domain
MTVRTMDNSQVRPLQEHLDLAAALDTIQIEQIRTLAGQLQDVQVLPILGAGASYDCGMRLAREIGYDLYTDYMANPAYEPHDAVSQDLADVAQAIHNAADQVAVVHAVGLPYPDLWPETARVVEHFCAYRILARLAREDLFDEAIGFNYDCGKEAGLVCEGFLRSPHTVAGRQFRDHVSVIADKATFYEPRREGALTYIKAHGCAERFRELAVVDEAKAAETIIIRKSQLTNWREDAWMQDRLRDCARTHVLLLIGFSALDATIHGELQGILEEVYREVEPSGTPRVVVIDWQPNTPTLHGLIKTGLGGENPPDGVVTAIDVSSASTTAAAMILLAETLRLDLQSHLANQGYALPSEIDPQLAALVISAPLMLRWTYMLRPRSENQFIQKINLEQAAEKGYVPLMADPSSTAVSLDTRVKLRQRLGRPDDESTRDALSDHGFITRGGFAYLPVALGLDELRGACRPGGVVDRAKLILGHPSHLECVLVADGPGGLSGVHIETGAEVGVPA